VSLRIAFQGEPGAYSEAAVFEHFGQEMDTLPCESFERVFQAVSAEECASGLIPIENSLAGSIHRNYDLLLRHDLWVTGEHYLPIHHCLIAMPGVKKSDIQKVISHPQALAQCDAFLRGWDGITFEPVYDTAGSVKMVKEQSDPSVAAIASRRAADLYQMSVLAENIEDNEANITRFLVIARDPVPAGNDAKTSIVFSLDNQPGSLFKALSVFALRNIDLTKIESRPLAGKPWEYFFYIDFAGSTDQAPSQRALSHLSEYAPMLRVFGSYPRSRGSGYNQTG
jgi:prephenate dehydratase